MKPRLIPALLCALALLSGCSVRLPAPRDTSTPVHTSAKRLPKAVRRVPRLPVPSTPGKNMPAPLQSLSGWAGAYADQVMALEAEEPGLRYDLIYLDEDDIPELAAGSPGYFISVYQYRSGTINTLIHRWGYGAMGNHGYEYIPKSGVIRNYNADLAGAILYVTYLRINDLHEMESCYDDTLSMWMFRDTNGDHLMGEDEPYSDEIYFYRGDQEISEEEFESYLIQGDYAVLEGNQTASQLLNQLQHASPRNAAQ